MGELEKIDVLITLLVNYRSRFIGDELPIDKIALYSFRLSKNYSDTLFELRERYENKTPEFITSDQFSNLKTALIENKLKLKSEIGSYRISKEIKSPQKKILFEKIGFPIFDDVLIKFMNQENIELGDEKKLKTLPKPNRVEIQNKLLDLSRLIIHLQVLEEVELKYLTEGKFEAKLTFYDVPSACKWVIDQYLPRFEVNLKDDVDELKELIKANTVILSKSNEKLKWSVINNRINSHITYNSN